MAIRKREGSCLEEDVVQEEVIIALATQLIVYLQSPLFDDDDLRLFYKSHWIQGGVGIEVDKSTHFRP